MGFLIIIQTLYLAIVVYFSCLHLYIAIATTDTNQHVAKAIGYMK